MKIVSNTEVVMRDTCLNQHYFAYTRELEPRQYPLPIRRGVVGHSCLETFYKALMNGASHDDAVNSAQFTLMEVIAKSDPDDYYHTMMLASLKKLLDRYYEFCRKDEHKIISVEQMIVAPFDEDTSLGLFVDLIVLTKQGYEIWDHKFVTNFKDIEQLKLDVQQPRYMKAATLAGYDIKRCIFNQIRTRSLKDPTDEDLFRRAPILTTPTMMDNIWQETSETVSEIYQEAITGIKSKRRQMTYNNCKNCFFKDPCMAELAGLDTTVMLNIDFRKRHRPLKDWIIDNG